MAVYFIGNGNGQVKIGVSDHPFRRMLDLQTASPYPLALLACAPGGGAKERDLHLTFADSRLCGEWFECSEKIRDYISACLILYGYPTESHISEFNLDGSWTDMMYERCTMISEQIEVIQAGLDRAQLAAAIQSERLHDYRNGNGVTVADID